MPFIKRQDPDGGTTYELSPRASQLTEFKVRFAGGVEAAVGRGSTDADIVYLRLRNADGEDAYVFPNATQDGITVQATRP